VTKTVTFVPLALGLAIVGAMSGTIRASTVASGDAAAIQAAMVRDMTVAVAPWIPCTGGKAAPLSAQVVRARQALVDTLISRTYAPSEPTHAGVRIRLHALIAAYGVGGCATRAGETLCDVGGGIDRVQAHSVVIARGQARMTIQAHEWNETVGRHNGVAFHFKPEALIVQTDEASLQHGQWLIARRGPATFLTGAP